MNFIIITILIIIAFPLYSFIMSIKPPKSKKEHIIPEQQWPNSLKFMAFVIPLVLIVCIILSIKTGDWGTGVLAFISSIGVGGVGALFLD